MSRSVRSSRSVGSRGSSGSTSGRRWIALATLLVAVAVMAGVVASAEAGSDPTASIPISAPAQHAHLYLRSVDRGVAIGGKAAGGAGPAAVVPLQYHKGGLVMSKGSNVFVIFWMPSHLQNGHTPDVSPKYKSLALSYFQDVQGTGIFSNVRQYFQVFGGKKTFIADHSVLTDVFTDTTPYPQADCDDPAFAAANCISDAKVQAEILKVASKRGWKPGNQNLYFVYTTEGEGSCQKPGASAASDCAAPGGYCAYHSFLVTGDGTVGKTFIYANMPYSDPDGCGIQGQNGPISVNNDPPGDANVSVTSHEQMEALTDPYVNTSLGAWFDSQGAEMSDKCSGDPGPGPYWKNNTATHMWNGHFYDLQSEWDNHVLLDDLSGAPLPCVQAGP
jgi:hypothetical protein